MSRRKFVDNDNRVGQNVTTELSRLSMSAALIFSVEFPEKCSWKFILAKSQVFYFENLNL